MRNVSVKVVQKIKTGILGSTFLSFPKIMPFMRYAGRITKATIQSHTYNMQCLLLRN